MTKHSRRDKESVAMCHRETIIVRVSDSPLSKAKSERASIGSIVNLAWSNAGGNVSKKFRIRESLGPVVHGMISILSNPVFHEFSSVQ